MPVAFLLGEGDDQYSGADATVTSADGGGGNDQLHGGAAGETLEGGAGNDIVQGAGGPDTLRGGPGYDKLGGDNNVAAAADVIDGGPDYDTIEDGYWDPSGGSQLIDLTLDGVANDGRPGEGDNVIAVEKVDLILYGRYVGSDAAEDFDVGDADHQTTVLALGGDDIVLTSVGDDVIDGGAGNDNLQGNRGNDTITGGPGRDTINGDTNSICTSLVCLPGAANDVIHARDGEVDQIACGFGADIVVADAIDVVSGDCEAVDRGSAAPPGRRRLGRRCRWRLGHPGHAAQAPVADGASRARPEVQGRVRRSVLDLGHADRVVLARAQARALQGVAGRRPRQRHGPRRPARCRSRSRPTSACGPSSRSGGPPSRSRPRSRRRAARP